MEVVKKTDAYSVIKKKSGRFGVKNSKGKWINGTGKVDILLKEGLVKVAAPKKEEAAPEAEAEISENAE